MLDIPEWKGSVRIRAFDAVQRGKYLDRAQEIKAAGNGKLDVGKAVRLVTDAVVMAVVDDDGKPVFKKTQVDALQKKNGDVLQRICSRVLHLSGLTEESMEAAVKNSATESDDSSSA